MNEEIKRILDSKKVQYAVMGLLPNQAEQVLSAMEFVSQKTAEEIFKALKCPECDRCEDYEEAWDMVINHIENVKKEFGVKE